MSTQLIQFQKHLSELAKNYRGHWQKELCESENIEAYGLNEFIGGKADAFEDCLDLLEKHLQGNITDTEQWKM